MASIQKTATGFRAQIFVKGIRDSACFRTKREALAWAEARTAELRKQVTAKEEPRTMTLADVLRVYGEKVTPTKKGHAKELVRINAMINDPWFPSKLTLIEITPEIIAQWRDQRMKAVKSGTVLRELGQLSAVFECCVKEWGWISENPVRMIRKPKHPEHRDVLYTRKQIKAILKVMKYVPGAPVRYLSQSVAICFLIALRTGMRAGEMTGLTWDRVFSDHVDLPVTKTKRRKVPLSDKALRLIHHMQGYDPVLVFGLSPQSLDANFRKYRKRAGIEGVTFHDTRHYAATKLAQKLNVLDLCRVMGWTNPKMAMVYVNTSVSDIARLLND